MATAVLLALTGCDESADQGLPQLPTAAPESSLPPSDDLLPSDDGAFPPAGAISPSGPGSPTFAEYAAVACSGRPPADQVIAVVRQTGLLAGAAPTVQTGPLCAGTWQYTVLAVPNREPLQVVTKGAPGSLSLVTAGTDVCTAEVRVAAPQGILAITHC